MMLLIAPMGAITSSNWIMMWAFLEMSSFTFIIVMDKKKSSEEVMKYFMIQTLSSIIFLLSISLKMSEESEMYNINLLISMLLILSVSIKSGMAPLHFWMPEITRKMKWIPLFFFLSIQKLAPTFILILNSKYTLVSGLIICSSIIGTMMQLNSLNMMILLTYSSVSHSSWMVLAGSMSNHMFFIYFITYCLMLSMIIMIFKKTFTTNILSKSKNFALMVNLLSFGGIPPLLGFMPKWMVVTNAPSINNMMITIVTLLLMSCMNIFIYIQIFYLKSVNTPLKSKKKTSPYNFIVSNLVNILAIPAIIFNIL